MKNDVLNLNPFLFDFLCKLSTEDIDYIANYCKTCYLILYVSKSITNLKQPARHFYQLLLY